MPAPSDILQFMRGQLFQTPTLPKADMAKKTVIVTGANSGLGLECAKHLVQLNVSTLILACRSLARGEAAKKDIIKSVPSKLPTPSIQVWEIDMADYTSVKRFSQRATDELPRLDALIVNAGISTNQFSLAESTEQTLTVNVTSAFLLSLLCLPILERTAKQSNHSTHLTIVGSNVHAFANPQELITPPNGTIFSVLSDQRKADMSNRYFLSKLIVMLCVREMSRRMSSPTSSRATLNCPSPGWCKTPLFRTDDGGFMGRNMLKLIGRNAEQGARCLTSAIEGGEETHGEYLSECQVKRSSVWVRSTEGRMIQEKLWEELIALLEGVSPGVSAVLKGPK